jgi:hypothetical protein
MRVIATLCLAICAATPPSTSSRSEPRHEVRNEDSGGFVLCLGRDTTSVERYHRTATRLEIEQVDRAGRVLERHFTYDLLNGAVTHATLVVTTPGTATPEQTLDETLGLDSARTRIQNGDEVSRVAAAAVPHEAIVVTYACPWAPYEMAIERLVRGGLDSLMVPLHVLGSRGTTWLSLHKIDRDSVDLLNHHQDHFHVRVDAVGHVLGALPIAGPLKFSVSRVADVNVAAYAADYAARERAGRGLGQLSPRDTVRASIAGASLWIDYGRPGKRGRVIYGNVVPYGEVWRTGANAATQFRTDRPLDFGGTVVPAGFYSLWTLPGPTGWKLIINGETGQWGTMHRSEKDLWTIEMNVSELPQAAENFTISIGGREHGGTLNLDWDTTRASAAFKVIQNPASASH